MFWFQWQTWLWKLGQCCGREKLASTLEVIQHNDFIRPYTGHGIIDNTTTASMTEAARAIHAADHAQQATMKMSNTVN